MLTDRPSESLEPLLRVTLDRSLTLATRREAARLCVAMQLAENRGTAPAWVAALWLFGHSEHERILPFEEEHLARDLAGLLGGSPSPAA